MCVYYINRGKFLCSLYIIIGGAIIVYHIILCQSCLNLVFYKVLHCIVFNTPVYTIANMLHIQ